MDRSLAALALASVCVSALLAGAPAWAATEDASTVAENATQVGELVVTAQKRSESIQTVPAAISALSGATLNQRGISDVGELQFAVPSFHSGTLTGSTGIT